MAKDGLCIDPKKYEIRSNHGDGGQKRLKTVPERLQTLETVKDAYEYFQFSPVPSYQNLAIQYAHRLFPEPKFLRDEPIVQ